MKKTLSVILAALVITAAFSGCSDDKKPEENVMETAQENISVSSANGIFSLDESTVKSLLGAYDKSVLGLSGELSEYTLKLSAEKISGSDGCKAEAYKKGSDTPEKTYGIIGSECYILDEDSGKYLLLTNEGAVEIVTQKLDENGFDIENSNAIAKLFKEVPKEKTGLPNDFSEYIFEATQETSTDKDGKTIYVIDVYEKDGKKSPVKLGFNEENRYVFNKETSTFEKVN